MQFQRSDPPMVTLDYRQDIIKAANVRGGFRMTANKKKKRRAAHCVDYAVACPIVE